MKRTLIVKIENEIAKLDKNDVEGHVWWNKFLDMVEKTNQHGEEQEIVIDINKLTVKQDSYNFKGDKK